VLGILRDWVQVLAGNGGCDITDPYVPVASNASCAVVIYQYLVSPSCSDQVSPWDQGAIPRDPVSPTEACLCTSSADTRPTFPRLLTQGSKRCKDGPLAVQRPAQLRADAEGPVVVRTWCRSLNKVQVVIWELRRTSSRDGIFGVTVELWQPR